MTLAPCAGTWPVGMPGIAGPPVPDLDTSGAVLGVCTPLRDQQVRQPHGGDPRHPGQLPTAIPANNIDNGPALTIGTSIYVPNSGGLRRSPATTTPPTRDVPTTRRSSPPVRSGLYTVNADPQRPGCLWVDSDQRNRRDPELRGLHRRRVPPRAPARSGRRPGRPGRVLSADLLHVHLQVTSPPRSTYTSATVSIEDNQGNPIAGLPTTPLDSLGTADLSGIPIVAKIPLPQFDISLHRALAHAGQLRRQAHVAGPLRRRLPVRRPTDDLRPRLRAGGVRRGRVHLRGRRFLRLDGEHQTQQADRRHGVHPGQARLLAGRLGRRRLRLRGRQVRRLDRAT